MFFVCSKFQIVSRKRRKTEFLRFVLSKVPVSWSSGFKPPFFLHIYFILFFCFFFFFQRHWILFTRVHTILAPSILSPTFSPSFLPCPFIPFSLFFDSLLFISFLLYIFFFIYFLLPVTFSLWRGRDEMSLWGKEEKK